MKELWEEIDYLQNIYDQNTSAKDKEESTPTLTPKGIYFLKHELIEMKRKQYPLMDSAFPTIPHSLNKAQYFTPDSEYHLNYCVYPRGLMNGEHDYDFMNPRQDKRVAAALPGKKPRYYIDFTNVDHIYQLVLNYWDLKLFVEKIPDSLINNLLWTLDFYIDKANLSEQQKLIVEDKKLRLSNQTISNHLQESLGIYHQENYVSTIWNKCCELIAAAAELNYDEFLCKDYDKAWKICSSCQKELLRDPRNFVRKARSIDGLTGRCKKCDKMIREKKKEEKANGRKTN